MMQRIRWLFAAVLCLMMTHAVGAGESDTKEKTDFFVGPEFLAIFPWDHLPATQADYHQARECGFNLAGFVAPENLDLVAAAKMKCFVSDPSINPRGEK